MSELSPQTLNNEEIFKQLQSLDNNDLKTKFLEFLNNQEKTQQIKAKEKTQQMKLEIEREKLKLLGVFFYI